VLAKNAGQVVSPRSLLREAQDYDCDDREAQDIIKVHIRHLRYKIEPDPDCPSYIVNVRGFGYRMEAPSSVPPTPPGR
jgi:DNA-binding response OmpR family regulator